MSSRSRLRSILTGSAVAAVAVSLTLSVSPAQADPTTDQPTTVAQAKALVDKLNTEAAAIDQEYAGAQEKAATSKKKLADDKVDLAAQQKKVDGMRDQVASFALATFQRRGASSTAAFMGGSDTNFFAKVSTIQQVSSNQVTLLQKYQAEQANLDSIKLAAESEAAVKAKAEGDMADARTRSEAKIAEANKVLSKLTAAERARIAAEEARVAEQARQQAARVAEQARQQAAAAAEAAQAAATRAAAEAAQAAATRAAAARTSRSNDRTTTTTTTSNSNTTSNSRSNTTSNSRSNTTSNSNSNSNTTSNSSSSSAAKKKKTSSAPASVPVSGRAATAVAFAKSQVGKPYRYGATGPGAYDCSSLTGSAWRAAGVSLPRTSQAQFGAGRSVSTSSLQPGDLVFYYSGISHVGIYIGGGMIVHAANPRSGVGYASLNSMPLMGARRPG